MSILQLAPELVVQVLAQLEFEDVLRCSQVCRKLNDVIEDSLLLRYMKELAGCGMVDGSGPTQLPSFAQGSNMTLAERYTKLLLFDATWRSLAWRKHEMLRIRGSTAVWDLYGGVIATGVPIEENRDRWKLEFRELDSLRRRGPDLEEVAHWSYEVDLPLVEMTMDPSQDLLVLLTVPDGPTRSLSIHMRALSNNAPHPSSRGPSFLQYFPTGHNQNIFDRRLGPWVVVQILGPMLGMLVFSEEQENRDSDDDYHDVSAHLVIWDWTSGERVASINGLQGPISFAFLNARYVMVSRLGNSITPPSSPELSSGPSSRHWRSSSGSFGPPQQPSLDIYDLHDLKTDSAIDARFSRRFLLPSVKPGARVQMVRVFSELSSTAPPAPIPLLPPKQDPDYSEGLSMRSPSSDLRNIENDRDGEVVYTNMEDRNVTGIGAGAPAPFTVSPTTRVFVVRLVLTQRRRRRAAPILQNHDWQSPTQEYAIFIPLGTLAAAFDESISDPSIPFGALPSHPLLQSKSVVPWADWGPEGARLLLLDSPTDFFDVDRSFYPYGPRCAIPLRVPDLDAEESALALGLAVAGAPAPAPAQFRFRVIDVNQRAVRRFVHSRRGRRSPRVLQNGSHSTVRAVGSDAPTVVARAGSFFAEDVVTSLPYLETRTGENVTFECDTVMLTEDSMITVKAEESHYSVQIYTF